MSFCRHHYRAVAEAGIAVMGMMLWIAGTEAEPLRVITYNVKQGTGWPENRPLAIQAVAEGQMATLLASNLASYHPDIISFSESPSEEIVREAARLLGMNYVRFPSGGYWPGTLLSRFEIIDAQNVPLDGARPSDLFTRHWGRATIKLPDGGSLIVHSAHLYPGEPAIRQQEIEAMLASMQADLDAGRSMLLMGDLNHTPNTEEYRRWIDAGWVDAFAEVGTGEGFTFDAGTPARRIDYVMATGPIADQIVESRPLFEGAFRLDLTNPEAIALSDHLPQFAEFRVAVPELSTLALCLTALPALCLFSVCWAWRHRH